LCKHQNNIQISFKIRFVLPFYFFTIENIGNSRLVEIKRTPFYLVLFLLQPVHQVIWCYFGLNVFIIYLIKFYLLALFGWPFSGLWILPEGFLGEGVSDCSHKKGLLLF